MSSTQDRLHRVPTESLGARLLGVGRAAWNVIRPQTRLTRYGSDVQAAIGGGKLDSEKTEYLPGMDNEQHPDMDLAPDTPEQRRRCTLAYYNVTLVKGIVESQIRQVVNTLSVQADTGSPQLDNKIDYAWKTYLFDRDGLTHLKKSLRHVLIDGGAVTNPLSNMWEPFEAQVIPYRLIQNPYDDKSRDAEFIRDGFRYDKKDRQQSFFVVEEVGIFENRMPTGRYKELPLFYHPRTACLAGQTRGLSWYAPAISRLEMLSRWMDALLQTMELHAYFVGMAKSGGQSTKALSSTLASGSTVSSASEEITQNDRKLLNWARKHRFMLFPAQGDMKLLQTQTPQLGDFIIWSLRMTARALGVSFERLTYDLSKTNYSSTKFGDRDDKITVREQQDYTLGECILTNRRILFQMALENQFATTDRLVALNELSRKVKFVFPARPPVDEEKFEKANVLSLQNKTNSRKRICSSLGLEWGEINSDLVNEMREMITTRRDLYTEFGMSEEDALKLALDDVRAQTGVPAEKDSKEEGESQQDEDEDRGVA